MYARKLQREFNKREYWRNIRSRGAGRRAREWECSFARSRAQSERVGVFVREEQGAERESGSVRSRGARRREREWECAQFGVSGRRGAKAIFLRAGASSERGRGIEGIFRAAWPPPRALPASANLPRGPGTLVAAIPPNSLFSPSSRAVLAWASRYSRMWPVFTEYMLCL